MPEQGLPPEVMEELRKKATPAHVAQYLTRDQPEEIQWKPYRHLMHVNRKLVEVCTDERQRFLNVSLSVRHGKSLLISSFLPIWYLGMYPHRNVIIISYNETKAKQWGAFVRDYMTTFGPELFGLQVDQSDASKTEWGLKGHRGRCIAAGIDGSLTGIGGDLIIIDDPIKNRQEASSPGQLESVYEGYNSNIRTRLGKHGTMILTMARWSPKDPAGMVRELVGVEGVDPWEVMDLPAIAEAPKNAGDDWRDEIGRADGEALCPELRSLEELERIKSNPQMALDWECTPAESPILMADFTTKSISEVRPGDQVVGFESGVGRGGKNGGGGSKLVVSTVKKTFSKISQVNELHMDSGNVVRCTPDHRWWMPKGGSYKGSGRQQYRPAKVGSTLSLVDNPGPEPATQREVELWHYLSGMIDGEGHVARSALSIAQSPEANPGVFAKLRDVLDELGLDYYIKEQDRPAPWSRSGEFMIRNTRSVYRRLLRTAPGGKAQQMVDALWTSPQKFVVRRDRVEKIVEGGDERVYALETTTTNYVVQGYASSNSLYQQRPNPPGGGMFKVATWRYTEATPVGLRCVRVWDLASTEGAGDWTVGTKVGVDSQNNLYIVDQQRFRKDSAGVKKEILRTAKEDGRNVPIGIEQERAGAGKAQVQDLKKMLMGYVVHAMKPEGTKEQRAAPYASQQQERNVTLVGSVDRWKDFVEEHRTFPNGRHDDQVDSAAGGVNLLAEAGAATITSEADIEGGVAIDQLLAAAMGQAPEFSLAIG